MIARLTGTIVEVRADDLVIDVNGVGYLVAAPATLVMSATVGSDIMLSISTVVREDAFLLYGFTDSTQREAFELLRGVSRIGPKNAMAMLSTMPVEQLATAIAAGDTAAISKAPGVGKRSAERICLELKNKLPAHFTVASPGVSSGRTTVADPLPLALSRLGYRKSEIDRVMADPSVPDYGEQPVEERLRACLRLLAQPG
ncbi:MAG: Holliday junction branch migration protein RuvA [Deltaproteobacteria bacterium]|nr:Holliday junction branch migration protein RuvA [Deltaproteobacteria bacterium]